MKSNLVIASASEHLALLMDAVRARSTNPAYDLNGDHRVDVADARYLALHFTNPGGAACP